MERYLTKIIKKTPNNKIILISGPRQVGKTTLSLNLFPDSQYLNWDNLDHRKTILERSWLRNKSCVIFDELHKMPKWKAWLKGIYDLEKDTQKFIVTGSAKLNTFKKVGDSLAGRFFSYTLHPFDLQEILILDKKEIAGNALKKLIELSGFPEPYSNGKIEFYRMWKKSHLDIILRQDLIDLKSIKEINKIELLIELLRSRIGSMISYHSLAEDLQITDATVRTWIQLLEDLYVIYKVTPYSKNIARSIMKMPKIYFYNHALVNNSEGASIENLVANALLKEIDFRNDFGFGEYELKYLRNKENQEIDFLILNAKKVVLLVEVKTSEAAPSKSFKVFAEHFKGIRAVQVVLNLKEEKHYPFGLEVVKIEKFLKDLRLYLL